MEELFQIKMKNVAYLDIQSDSEEVSVPLTLRYVSTTTVTGARELLGTIHTVEKIDTESETEADEQDESLPLVVPDDTQSEGSLRQQYDYMLTPRRAILRDHEDGVEDHLKDI